MKKSIAVLIAGLGMSVAIFGFTGVAAQACCGSESKDVSYSKVTKDCDKEKKEVEKKDCDKEKKEVEKKDCDKEKKEVEKKDCDKKTPPTPKDCDKDKKKDCDKTPTPPPPPVS